MIDNTTYTNMNICRSQRRAYAHEQQPAEANVVQMHRALRPEERSASDEVREREQKCRYRSHCLLHAVGQVGQSGVPRVPSKCFILQTSASLHPILSIQNIYTSTTHVQNTIITLLEEIGECMEKTRITHSHIINLR